MRFLLLLCLPACRDALIDSPEAEETGESETGETGETETGETGETGESGDTQDTYDTGEPVDTGDPLKVYDLAFPALISDGGNERFMAMDLANGDVYWTYDMRLEEPELCQPEEAWECGAYGAIHQVDAHTGEDLFTFTWHRMSVDSPTDIGSRQSRVERIRLGAEDHSVDWSLQDLDFQTHFADTGLCNAKSACEAPIDAGQAAWADCSMVMVHDVEIIEESESEVRMWLADTANSRAILVRLPTDSTCGVVEDVIDAQTASAEDWDHFTWVNDIDHLELDGEERLLITTKGSDSFVEAAHGRGKLTLWAPGEESWELEWEHPVRDEKNASFLNAPHNADWVTDIDGRHYVIYAHSNGAGEHFEDEIWTAEEDHLGSMGVLRVDHKGPAYLGEFMLDVGELGFTRDVDRLADGSWIVTDSGCKGELGCPKESGIRHVDFPLAPLEATGEDGRFHGTGFSQSYHQATELETHWESPRTCELAAAYESDPITELGSGLNARMEAPEFSCN